MTVRNAVTVIFAGCLVCIYNSCGVPTSNQDSGTIMGNPLTRLSIAPYSSQVGDNSLSAVNLCIQGLALEPSTGGSSVQLAYGTQVELAIPQAGVDLESLAIPNGNYSQIEIMLSNICGTQRSIGIVNSQGTFNSEQSISLVFDGPIIIDSSTIEITFEIQPIANHLSQAVSDTDLIVQATVSPGQVTLGDIWGPGPTTLNAPTGRENAMSVWTGSRMIVWGGDNPAWLNTGGVYDPVADSWSPTSVGANVPVAQYGSAFAWTGTEMILWSGQALTQNGSRYNPATDQWVAMSTTNAPAARHSASAVWSGTELLVWGGYDGGAPLSSGGRYNPSSNTWTAMSTVGAPPAANSAGTVWTGTQLLVWGGDGVNDQFVATGGCYSPSTDSWSAISMAGAPSPRSNFTAIWTGTELIIWGGSNGSPYGDGARYDPTTNTWSPMSQLNAPSARHNYAVVWTGSKMLIWGGSTLIGATWSNPNDGGLYDPQTDTWTPISNLNAPVGREGPLALWMGTSMMVWGGSTVGGSPYFSDGGVFTP